jgi:hypothetical protein
LLEWKNSLSKHEALQGKLMQGASLLFSSYFCDTELKTFQFFKTNTGEIFVLEICMYVKNGQKSVDYVTQDIDIFFDCFTSWKMKYFTCSTYIQVASIYF